MCKISFSVQQGFIYGETTSAAAGKSPCNTRGARRVLFTTPAKKINTATEPIVPAEEQPKVDSDTIDGASLTATEDTIDQLNQPKIVLFSSHGLKTRVFGCSSSLAKAFVESLRVL